MAGGYADCCFSTWWPIWWAKVSWSARRPIPEKTTNRPRYPSIPIRCPVRKVRNTPDELFGRQDRARGDGGSAEQRAGQWHHGTGEEGERARAYVSVRVGAGVPPLAAGNHDRTRFRSIADHPGWEGGGKGAEGNH